ncbi:MAG: zinc-dependent metalloprotease [Flavobacteriaceae bacterium]|nr:zinc-dependent metalloprotease [Flavobacteriaceae bacterium]
MKNIITLFAILFCINQVVSQKWEDKKLQEFEGLFDFYYEEAQDKIFLKVKDLDKEFLYVNSLAQGVGSNDIGLDRGQLGDSRIVKFVKAGNKLLLVQPNQDYRAITENDLERRSVEEAFAKSVLYGFKIEKEDNGNYIIDLTPMLLEDAHGVAYRLKRSGEGNYKLDASKSALALERTKAFPLNVEFEAMLTFEGTPEGRLLRTVVPTPSLVTVNQHHSFVQLPDDKYEPREFDPRSGAIMTSYFNYSTPVYEPIQKRYIVRHRLEKKNPNAEISEAVEPIIYYLDPGTPEPIKSALLDGARWWNQAFEAIGFRDAFQVKMLPEGADPLDCRYNVIQWVHRSTRGWSYGASVRDPRTGEIIKGHVSLGSLRMRLVFMIAQALLDEPFADSDENYQPMLDLALARIRQLSAHEVGHTLGFTHNFAASTNDRASVMDYPHPNIQLKSGKIDLSDAYDTGIGEWDKVTVAYSYSVFPNDDAEKEGLDQILRNASKEGLRFITDYDARAQDGAHALAHLWDGGVKPAEELKRLMKLRETAIENFSEDNIRTGTTFSQLEDVFVPLYFFHRYQTEAVSKIVGGLDYNYAVKGDGQLISEYVSPKEQKEAFSALLLTLNAENLAIPKKKLNLFPPRAYGFSRSRESFNSKTGVAFDPLSAAATASEMTLELLLNPARANRLVQQKSLDQNQLGLAEVLRTLIDNSFGKKQSDTYLNEVQQMINVNVLNQIMKLAVDDNAFMQVQAISQAAIEDIERRVNANFTENSYSRYYKGLIDRFKDKPEEFKIESSPRMPDGSPIGSDICNYLSN